MTAATSAVVVLFSSSSAAAQFALLGRIPIAYALLFGAVCFAASVAGVVAVSRAVRATGRPSVVVLVLAAVILVCSAVFSVTGARRLVEDLSAGRVGLNNPCRG